MKLLWQIALFVSRVLARLVVYAFIERWIPLDQPLFGEAKPAPVAEKQPKAKQQPKRAKQKTPARQQPDVERYSEGAYDVRFSRDRDSVTVDWSELPPAPRKPRAPAEPGRHPLVRNASTVRSALVLSAALGKRRLPFR